MHTVSPNAAAYSLGSVSSVEGLFPCGALVNHSCLPNSCFHCVSKAASSVDGPPVIEQVLRTTRHVRAGEELCYSYLSELVAASTVSVSTVEGVKTRKSWTGHTAFCDDVFYRRKDPRVELRQEIFVCALS